MSINPVIQQIINNSISEAQDICGSEGLYQCIIYNSARNHPDISYIEREYKIELQDGKVGYLDFVFIIGDTEFAIELKAGANSYRNSLNKAKEIDSIYGASKTGGVLKDIAKLGVFLKETSSLKREAFLVCQETAYIPRGFSDTDVKNYSQHANDESICFVYGTSGYSAEARWINKQFDFCVALKQGKSEKTEISNRPTINQLDWNSFFSEVEDASLEDETFCQAILYHYLRILGLSQRQCASEVFFHFAKKPNTRASYWVPDIACFDDTFNGRFNLGVNNDEKRQNDYEKLKALSAIIEIKGSRSFSTLRLEKKIELITEDLEKLSQHLFTAITLRIRAEGILRKDQVKLIMVVACSDMRLRDFIVEAREKYRNKIEILWSGDYP